MSIEVIGYHPVNRNTLQGYVNIYVPKMGLEIYGIQAHMKNGQRWINLPSKPYEDRETGETKYSPIIRFRQKEHFDKFQQVLLSAIDMHCTSSRV